MEIDLCGGVLIAGGWLTSRGFEFVLEWGSERRRCGRLRGVSRSDRLIPGVPEPKQEDWRRIS